MWRGSIDIMQISGHTNVAFINNYSTLSEERHKKISNILSNTESETNRNAFQQTYLVKSPQILQPSSTSDVSCRSNPDVPSYSSNTNMSSQISSMFYGVVIHNKWWMCTQFSQMTYIPITEHLSVWHRC